MGVGQWGWPETLLTGCKAPEWGSVAGNENGSLSVPPPPRVLTGSKFQVCCESVSLCSGPVGRPCG